MSSYNLGYKLKTVMKVENITVSTEDVQQIQEAVKNRNPVEFSCYTLTNEQKSRFLDLLKIFLDECDQAHLFNCLSYCLLELLDNASKANAKRIYFEEEHLDINNSEDYQNGMRNFKNEITENPKHYFEELETGFLKVDLLLSLDNTICLQVSNNTEITEVEYNRIQEKIEKTKHYTSLEDAFGDIDQTEGSGLGIISIILMLKKLGLNTDNLRFKMADKRTIATIEIPVDSFEEL